MGLECSAPSACGAGAGVRLAWLLTGLCLPTLWGPLEAAPALQSLPCRVSCPVPYASVWQGGVLHRREEQRRRKARREALAAEILDKHPLQNRWALWFFKNDKSQTWQANLRLVTKFSTAEDFWALYSHIQLASKLTSGCDYSLFKDGIEPMWEDNRNKRGGRWLITLAKQQRHTELDRFWLETAGVQGAPGAVSQGGDRVPGPRGHGHQEWLPHQEQVCGVSSGLGSWDL
ncbi:eukaryotic translation initiation factor 4E type 1B isoform X2 [Trachemys scripta elegans]|uniref:eukaryotic translation initiation factor 4E type 1B isoform X2 n=1 Tax=Trachemys scripta elegans TaxID=31138 RepID=UPI00155682A8|nr:eukaryotic translation initiation factor 4E type 1B isoform X2 [Trachemys scripta elegans]